jgi:hypothetical protein
MKLQYIFTRQLFLWGLCPQTPIGGPLAPRLPSRGDSPPGPRMLALRTDLGCMQVNPEVTSNHFGLETSLSNHERDLSNNVTKTNDKSIMHKNNGQTVGFKRFWVFRFCRLGSVNIPLGMDSNDHENNMSVR